MKKGKQKRKEKKRKRAGTSVSRVMNTNYPPLLAVGCITPST